MIVRIKVFCTVEPKRSDWLSCTCSPWRVPSSLRLLTSASDSRTPHEKTGFARPLHWSQLSQESRKFVSVKHDNYLFRFIRFCFVFFQLPFPRFTHDQRPSTGTCCCHLVPRPKRRLRQLPVRFGSRGSVPWAIRGMRSDEKRRVKRFQRF